MTRRLEYILLTLFLIGWVTYAFALFNVGRFSITLLLLASFALAVFGFRLKMLFSTSASCLLLSIMLAWSVAFLSYAEMEKTFTHLVQGLLGIGVMFSAQSINWDIILPKFQKILVWIAVVVLSYAFYQFFARLYGLPYAFLPMSNLQLSMDEGFQRGAMNFSRGSAVFTRVSSFFAEPSDFGRFMLWVFAFGYGCSKNRLRLFLMSVGVVGILISQSMSGIIGMFILVFVFTVIKQDYRSFFRFLFVGGLLLTIIFLFLPQISEGIRTRSGRILYERGDYLYSTKRFSDVNNNVRFFFESPLVGHGLASIKKEIPDNAVSSAWELLLIERGILGTLFFMVPFFWAFARLGFTRGPLNELENTALLVLIVEVFNFTTFGSVFFTPTYLSLGYALRASANKTKWNSALMNMRVHRMIK